MRVKYIQDETFQDYYKTSMFIGTCFCDFKCCVEQEIVVDVCQNSNWNSKPIIDIPNKSIIDRYMVNPLNEAVVIGGLEPMLQFEELIQFVADFREKCKDDIVIYTGYTEEEVKDQIEQLKQFQNIIVKFGRFQFNGSSKFDEVLGIKLASANQYAKILK